MRRRASSLSNNAWEAGGITDPSGKIQKKKAHAAMKAGGGGFHAVLSCLLGPGEVDRC